MKSQTLKSLILTAMVLPLGMGSIKGQDGGQTIFNAKCTACHSIGQGKLVGPDLAGLTGRRTLDWVTQFVKSSQAFIATGDAEAVKVFEENNKMVMPDQALTDDEVKQVYDYIGTQSGGGDAAANAGPAPEDTLKGDAAVGKDLFVGIKRLTNGGPSCNSCHNVEFTDLVTGGALAKDLTDAHKRLGDAGITSMLKTPAFPPMVSSYGKKPLTPQEIADLRAFLAQCSAEQGAHVASKPMNYLLFGGFGAATVLLGAFSLIWARRRRSTINKRIYDRQIKSK